MADYSVTARLSAVDSGFTSTLKSALGTCNNFGDTLKSGFGFGVFAGIGQQAFSMVSSAVQDLGGEAISASDSMQKLQQAMRFSGTSESEIQRIAGSTGTLKTYADKTVFSLEDVMSTFGALSANGVADAEKLTESVGNAVAVFGGGAQEFSSVALAFSQSMAAGKMNAQDWNQVLNASPQLAGGLKKELQKLNPVLAEDFKGGMEDGAITADLLAQAMNNIGMTDMAKEAASSVTTFEGAMGNLEATVQSGLMTLWDSFAKSGVIDAINSFNGAIGAGFDWLAGALPSIVDTVKEFASIFSESFSGVGTALGEAFSAIKEALGGVNGEFSKTDAMDNFKNACDTVAGAIKAVAGFMKEHADTIAAVLPWVVRLAGAFAAYKVINSVAPWLTSFAGSLLKMAGSGIKGLAVKLFGIAKGEEAAGNSAQKSSKQMLASAKAFMMIGAGVLMIAGGIALLAFSAIALAEAGWPAIAVMAGLTLALAGLAIGMMAMLNTVKAAPKKLNSVALAMLALGAAVLMIGAGFALLAVAAIALANAGWPAIAVMVGLVAVIALLAVGAAALGTALTAGAVGFLAFGAALLLVGVGAILAATAVVILSTCLPVLVQYGLQASVSLLALGGALLVFGAGALVAGAGALVLGAGLLVVAAAVLVVAAGFLVLSVGALITAASLAILAAVMPLLANYGLQGAVAILAISGAMLAFAVAAGIAGAGALLLVAGLLLLSATALVAGVGLMLFGTFAMTASVGLLLMATALLVVESSMSSIAKSATKAKKALNSMQDSVSIVQAGLDGLGNLAESAMDGIAKAFKGAADDARSAGREVANGFTEGMQTIVVMAPAIALMGVAAVNKALMSGQSGAYEAGQFISIGFANGMMSMLGTIRSAANKMVAQANRAIEAKAKIGSPSKITTQYGEWYGQGYVNGIDGMARDAWKAAENLVSMPTLATPDLANAYDGGISSEYAYYRNAEYVIQVPLTIDGREYARATAHYNEAELNRRNLRESRKHGIV